MKKILTLIFILFSLFESSASNKALFKANILRGESFVTVNINQSEIENVIRKGLEKKGYQILENIGNEEDFLLIDVFVFQHPGEYPTAVLTARTLNGIHFIDSEHITFFGDRKSANIKIVSRLMEKFPKSIDENRIFQPTLNDILVNTRISTISLISDVITKKSRSNYSSTITWPEGNEQSFIFPDEFDMYTSFISNIQGAKSALKGETIKLNLKINELARFELVEINSDVSLTEKQKNILIQFVNSFPLWATLEPIDNIELSYKFK